MLAVAEVNADLHSHSSFSDGTLAPRALVERARARGVDLLALTDHDELRGLAPAAAAARELGLRFVAGVEISITYAGQTVHVVGLGIDPGDAALAAGLAAVRSGRMQRAHDMAAGLAAAGIGGALEGALAFVANPDLVSRTHFARYLVQIGACRDLRQAFARYLTEGRCGYVPHRWATLEQALRWIAGAGGVAVIAHPGRYKLCATALAALFGEFRDAGGIAVEIATSSHGNDEIRRFARMAQEFGLEGSRGSDFHGPGETLAELGAVAPLPRGVAAVWQRFR